MALRLWLTIICLSPCVVKANLCNGPCSCVDKTVDCSKLKLKTQFNETDWNGMETITEAKFGVNQITHIRPYPKLPLVYLSLKHNLITNIDEGSFSLLDNLTELDMSNNYLHTTQLTPDVFKGQYKPGAYQPMKKLITLKLSENELNTLHPDLFEHLPKLENLFLNNNPFKIIDRSTVIAISSIQSLKLLDLSATHLTQLPEYIFHTPRFLSILNLSLNQFKTIPDQLEHSQSLQYLYMDDNPIVYIDHFPQLPKLEVLHMNWMQKLESIGPNSLSNLTKLKELHCHHNSHLTEISEDALIPLSPSSGAEGPVWPALTKLYLQNNNLGYLDSGLVGRWDLLEDINLKGNPWVCDCENQWIVEDLIPRIKALRIPNIAESIMCHEPVEMRGISMVDLQERKYVMRCLDKYGNRPEKDGAILIGIFIALFFIVPLITAAIVVYRRRNLPPKHFSRAFYKRADSTQYFINAMQ